MTTKYQFYTALAEKQTEELTQSLSNWRGLLSTIGRLYKYPFEEQLLIHAQRPDAIACATYETWRDDANRYIKYGSKGIALLDTTGATPKLKYVFDLSDTDNKERNLAPDNPSRSPFIWKGQIRYEPAIVAAFDEKYNVCDMIGKPPIKTVLGDCLFVLAQSLSARYCDDNMDEIMNSIEGSHLADLDEYSAGIAFRDALTVSTAYALMTRCGVVHSQYIDHENFQPIFDFNTPDSVYMLGKAVSTISEEVLREIEITIKIFEREIAKEEQHDRNQLHTDRGLSAPEHSNTGNDGIIGEIRDDAEGLSASAQGDSVLDNGAERDAVPALSGDRENSEREIVANDKSESGTNENADRGNDNQRTDSQLDTIAPDDTITEDEISAYLTKGSGFSESKFRIYSFFLHDHDAKEKADFLKREYGTGGRTHAFPGVDNSYEDHDSKGLHFKKGNIFTPSAKVSLTWTNVANRIDSLIAENWYMTESQLERIPAYERQILGAGIINFYRYLPKNVPCPVPIVNSSDYWGEAQKIGDMLLDADTISAILASMNPILEKTLADNRHYDSRNKTFRDLTAFANGTFTLFPNRDNASVPTRDNEAEPVQLSMFPSEQEQIAAINAPESEASGIPITKAVLNTFNKDSNLHYAIDKDGALYISNGFYILKTTESNISDVAAKINGRKAKNIIEPVQNEQILTHLERIKGNFPLAQNPHVLDKGNGETVVYSDDKQYFQYNKIFVDMFDTPSTEAQLFVDDNTSYDGNEHGLIVKSRDGSFLGLVLPVMTSDAEYELLAEVIPLKTPRKSELEHIKENPTNDPYIGKEYFDGNETYIISGARDHNGETVYMASTITEGKLSRHALMIPAGDIEKRIELWESNRIFNEQQKANAEIKAQKEAEAKAVYEDSHGFADNLPPMQKANVLKTLDTGFFTNDYGNLSTKKFIETAIMNGKSVVSVQNLKKKYSDMNTNDYLRELQHTGGFSLSDSIIKARHNLRHAISEPDNPESEYALSLKENHPFLYYKIFGNREVLPKEFFQTEYRLLMDDRNFFTIGKTAHDYGRYLIDNNILEVTPAQDISIIEDGVHYTPNKNIPYREGDTFGQLSMIAVITKIDNESIYYNLTDTPELPPMVLSRQDFEELLDSGINKIIEQSEMPEQDSQVQASDLQSSDDDFDYIPFSDDEANELAVETATPIMAIADYVKSKLETGEKFTSAELFAEASKAYGDTMANNAFTSKDAYDGMELGVNQFMLSMDAASLDSVMNALDLLPSQTRRTSGMELYQQFSTPPSIAYLANWAARVNADDIVLEPSAGIGGIAVFAKKDGAQVYVNELDKRRLEIIRSLPFDGFFNEDAEQINNIHGDKLEPTVIVMNPPFSSSAERNIHDTKIGAKHIEEALKMLAPNGRLVAVVGQSMADDAPAFRSWWRDIKEQYNVRANIGIDGKNYNKYGTTFGIQMLVIDKTGATIEPTITAFIGNLQDVQNILEGVRNDRSDVEIDNRHERNPAESTRIETFTERESGHEPDNAVLDANSDTDTGANNARHEQTVTPETNPILGGTTAIVPGTANVGNDGIAPNVRVGRYSGNDGRNDGNNGFGRTGTPDIGQFDGSIEPRVKKELTDSIFENYEPQSLLLENVQSHPANISESAAMSAIQPPPVTYKPNLSQDIIDKGILSDVQLEAVTYAGQSHRQILPNGNTRGFFLGDGTGVGKGRTVTGIILDNFNQGSKKAVWLSENTGLVPDAKRDVKALFGSSDLVTEFKGGKSADASLSNNEAILFATYSALSKGFDQSGSNFEKIVNWLGKDFDGVIVFDEAHNMANSTTTKGSRGIKKASQRGMAGLAIQDALPNAKIIYSSATGATEVENLRYAERLGLWGEGTAFPNGDDFVHRIKAGGLAAMELIARDMKAMGVYLSRNISYEDVLYDKIVHELTPEQRQIYDELARSWQIVLQNINQALKTTNQDKDGMAKGKAYGAFWSAEQRFFNQILTAMQVPSMIADIQRQLDNDNSIVIQLVSTNESAQEREFARLQEQDLDLEDFDLTPKQMLMSYIENSFPTVQFDEYLDENGNTRSKPVYDSEGKAVINREAVRQKEELLDKLGSIKVPASALDMIINHFGSDMVAENTGRKRRVVITDGKAKEENIAAKKQADVSAFQDGDKRIIIFSKAGGTGKSYHADKSAKNQQHRVHYLLQAGWQADAAVQGFGRSHRSNQVSSPTFSLVTTDLKGQMRFISTIAKRLDQLGALTKGQRQTGSQGLFTAGDNLENAFAADVLAMYYKVLAQNGVNGVSDGVAIIEKLGLKDKLINEYGEINGLAPELREVNKFLNRILSLECHEQNAVFDGYAERLHIATERAMQEGTIDRGLENYKADKVVLNETHDIRTDESTGAVTKYYNLTAHNKLKPLQFTEVDTSKSAFIGFYQSEKTGAVKAAFKTSSMTDEYGNVTDNCRLTGQDGNDYTPLGRLVNNWNKIEPETAKELWDKACAELPEFRTNNLHLIGGAVLPVWDKLPTENVRIYRVLTTDGDLLIGRVVPEDMIDVTLDKLGASREKEIIETADLIKYIKNGDTVCLNNDWRIVQKRVSGEQRIEIIGADYLYSDLLVKKGAFTERIGYQTRYFIPAETDTVKILDDVLKIASVSRIEKSKERIAEKSSAAKKEPGILEMLEIYSKKSKELYGDKSNKFNNINRGGHYNQR